jgi:hypothetical protein
MPFGQAQALLELLDERTRLEREAGAIRGQLTQANRKISELVKPCLDAAYLRHDKPSGTVKFALDNHLFQAVVDKRVEWNSDALKDVALEMLPQEASELFRITYSVPEANFKSVLNPTLKAKLVVARTVKYGEPKISLAD